jgi:hypothetical protein
MQNHESAGKPKPTEGGIGSPLKPQSQRKQTDHGRNGTGHRRPDYLQHELIAKQA